MFSSFVSFFSPSGRGLVSEVVQVEANVLGYIRHMPVVCMHVGVCTWEYVCVSIYVGAGA